MNTRFWELPGKDKKSLVIIYLCFDNIVLILFTFSIVCVLDDGFVRAGISVRERRERRRRRAHDSKKFFINTLIFIILFIINFIILLLLLYNYLLGDDE